MDKNMPVGLIELGLMGHGIPMKIAMCGFSLTIMGNPRIKPVAELINMWVRQQRSMADIAKNSDQPPYPVCNRFSAGRSSYCKQAWNIIFAKNGDDHR